jgi:hypothetical protein
MEGLGSSAGDPLEVADAIVELVESNAGTRPLRVAVPSGSPADAINSSAEPIQRAALEAFGLGHLTAPVTTPA